MTDLWIINVTAAAGATIVVLAMILPAHSPIGFALTGFGLIAVAMLLQIGNMVARKKKSRRKRGH